MLLGAPRACRQLSPPFSQCCKKTAWTLKPFDQGCTWCLQQGTFLALTSCQLIREVPSHARVIFRSCSEAMCGKVAACVSFRVSHCYRCEIHTCFWFGRHCINNFSLLYIREEVLFARNLFFLTLIPSVRLMNPRASIYLFVLAEYKSPTFTLDAFPSLSPSFSLPESQCSSQK